MTLSTKTTLRYDGLVYCVDCLCVRSRVESREIFRSAELGLGRSRLKFQLLAVAHAGSSHVQPISPAGVRAASEVEARSRR